MTLRYLAMLAAFAAGAPILLAQGRGGDDGIVIFKGGFTLKGRIVQAVEFQIDFKAKQMYSIPTGFIYVDDIVRRVYFAPGQIQDDGVIKLKAGELGEEIKFINDPYKEPRKINLAGWSYLKIPEFDKNWNRILILRTSMSPKLEVPEKVSVLTSKILLLQSRTHIWEPYYFTKERPVEEIRKLVADLLDNRKDYKELKPGERQIILTKFLHQAGFFEEADAVIRKIDIEKIPEHRKSIEQFIETYDRDRADRHVKLLAEVSHGKQYSKVRELLQTYEADKVAAKVSQKSQVFVQDLKNTMEENQQKLAKVQSLFKYLMDRKPSPRGFWLNCGAAIVDELTLDTLPRIETFITFAEQHKREIEQGRPTSQKLEQVLSLAVTGWHLGNIAAEPEPKLAEKMWRTRTFVAELMKTQSASDRTRLIETWQRDTYLPIDVASRVLQHLPPPNAYDKFATDKPFELPFDLPDGSEGSYIVQLPPDYNHHRPHPMLMVMHGGRERPEDLLARLAPFAAKHGFILLAPRWFLFDSKTFGHSERDQRYFLNCLKDMRRRFQVDTERTFLFGWDLGGDIAWDFGLTHPDQFAGVLPMCGSPRSFVPKLWPNAQFLPTYIVDGDRDGPNGAIVRTIFKDWIRLAYPGFYFEYKGRGNEIFTAEFEPMFQWMKTKTRLYSTRSLGASGGTPGFHEEFKAYRNSDARFYWISAGALNADRAQNFFGFDPVKNAAFFQGSIQVVNESDAKGKPKIYNQVNLRVGGVKQVSVLLSPNMIDFTKPVLVRVNNVQHGDLRVVTPSFNTLFEEYFQSADRQRLFQVKLDMNLKF